MKVLRSTYVHPKNGAAGAVQELLDELDGFLSKQPGFIESYELENTGSLGQVSVWGEPRGRRPRRDAGPHHRGALPHPPPQSARSS